MAEERRKAEEEQIAKRAREAQFQAELAARQAEISRAEEAKKQAVLEEQQRMEKIREKEKEKRLQREAEEAEARTRYCLAVALIFGFPSF